MSFPTIPDQEFKQRMADFKKNMAESQVDLVAVYSNLLDPSSVRYFTDVSPINESAAMVIPLEGQPILCSGQACHEWSRFKSKVEEVRILPEVGEVSGVEYDLQGQLDFEDLFREIKKKYSIKKIGIVGELIFPYAIYKKLEKVFPKAEKINAENMLYSLRMQKSKNEIDCMKKAAEIITETFAYAASRLKVGMTELDIQADIEAQMLRLGAEAYCNSFAPMIPSGKFHSNLCMNRNTLKKVGEGEIIDLQAGTLYEGYNAVICTPVVLGAIDPQIKEAVKVAYEAENVVADALKPGANSKQLYQIYNDFLDKQGYAKYSPYGSVHSIGMLECETPFFSANREVSLRKNMAIAIDVYFKGLPWGSFRIEDTYIVGENGAELLTTFNKRFICKKYA